MHYYLNKGLEMTTRKFPRTMNEAFGPYATGPIEDPMRPMDWQDIVVIFGCIFCVVSFIGMMLWGVV
jgi:hypothetical protein